MRSRIRAVTPLLVVSDLQRSIDFYARALGFVEPNVHGDPPCFAMMNRDGFDLMLSLGEDGLAKVKAGVTTPEELLRVVTEVREMRTLCGGCGNAVAIDFVACPSCGHRLQNACGKCNRTLQPGWNVCPYCASSSEPKPKSKSKRLRAGESSDLPAPTRVTEFKKA